MTNTADATGMPGTHAADAESRLPAFPLPSTSRWQPLRAGIIGIHRYDEQTFVFSHGKLLLRGLNGTGKSVAEEVLLPYLLDASIAPERISTFGGRDRSMHWKIIGHDESGRTNGRAYTWVEFGRLLEGGGAEYFTIGAGLEATRSDRSSVRHWYFTTGRRVGRDLHLLYRREPLAQRALTDALGDDGVVSPHTDADAYRRRVNATLYGLPDDQFRSLRGMLIELRKPKLSDKLDPDRLSDLLSNALPQISSTVITTLADGFERLDRHSEDLRDLEATTTAAADLAATYRRYARRVTRSRAGTVRSAQTHVDAVKRARNRAEAEVTRLTGERDRLQLRLTELETTRTGLASRRDALKLRPEFTAGEQIRVYAEEADAARAHATRLASERSRAQGELDSARAKLASAEKALDAATGAEARGAAAAADAATTVGLREQHERAVGMLQGLDTDAVRPAETLRPVRESIDHANADRVAALRTVRRVAAESEQAAALVVRAREETEKASGRLADAEQALNTAEAALADAQEAYAAAVYRWVDALVELAVQRDVVDRADPAEVIAAADAAHIAATARLTEQRTRAASQQSEVRREVDGLQSERDRLLAEPRPVRPVPYRRTDPREGRSGAVLYQLIDFRDPSLAETGAGLEAACEALGLLDAWVRPDGTLAGDGVLDLFAAPRGPLPTRSLADAVAVDPAAAAAAGIEPQVVSGVLARIALEGVVSPEPAPADSEHSVAVGFDGSWRTGPLHGTTSKEEVELIGAANAERTRQRQLADLARRIEAAQEQDRLLTVELQAVDGRLRAARDERHGLPSDSGIRAAAGRVESAGSLRRHAAEQLATRRDAERQAVQVANGKADELRLLADAHGLAGWLGDLDGFGEALNSWRTVSAEWLTAAAERARAVAEVGSRFADHAERDLLLGTVTEEHRQADLRALAAEERHAVLVANVGTAHTDIVRQIAELETELRAAGEEQRAGNDRRVELAAELSSAERTLETTESDRLAALEDRRNADIGFVALARLGVLAAAGYPGVLDGDAPFPDERTAVDPQEQDDDAPPADQLGGSTHTQVLAVARDLAAALDRENVPSDADAIEKAGNLVRRRKHELTAALESLRPVDRSEGGVLVVVALKNNRELTLPALMAELESDVAAARSLLSEDEQRLFDEFLTGQVRVEVAERVRDAGGLVRDMNRNLAGVRTASGLRVKLDWHPAAEAAEGTREVLALLLRDPDDLYASQREDLLTFFRNQLDLVRSQPGDGDWSQKLLQVLDYRRWFTFGLQLSKDDGPFARLTRKAHAQLSGGEKAVSLHLPLFAAASAYYRGAAVDCPRLVVLDEVFAGVDDELRGQLFELLVAFDLDLLATSERETGTHRELDGIAVYQLVNYEGMPWVLALRSIWTGEELIQAFEEDLIDEPAAAEASAPPSAGGPEGSAGLFDEL